MLILIVLLTLTTILRYYKYVNVIITLTMNKYEFYTPADSFIRVAAACPEVSLGDVSTNTERIAELYVDAKERDASLVAFPELSLTGYTLGDVVQQTQLLKDAETGLADLAAQTLGGPAMVVGAPLRHGNGLYNCAAVLADGVVKGVVPKTNLPTYSEFYEDRWFEPWQETETTIKLNGEQVPFGRKLLFDIADTMVGIEICEDLWVPRPPSGELAELGAQIIINPSASPEQVGKAEYRRDLVGQQSGRLIAAYVYAGSDVSESTAEIVMGGHQLIAQNGRISAERVPFGKDRLIITDVDVDHLEFDRRHQHMITSLGALVINTQVERGQNDLLFDIDRNPFLPDESLVDREHRLQSVVAIQANGLAQRMRATHQERLVLGLSGGLDSTLALLIACEAADILGRPRNEMIRTLTMPGMASSEHTQSNAQILAQQLGVPNEVIPIEVIAKTELAAISHDGATQDITYENVQARARTSVLFNYGNKNRAMVLGTGDLSEIALGWSTYNADQQSHYNVNTTIPKTLVRALVVHLGNKDEFSAASQTLQAVIETPISPELTNDKTDGISQTTEDIIGPYELHDFFLHQVIRWGDEPAKIAYLAEHAFAGTYDKSQIDKWLGVFQKRFRQSQFKRENMPNGPKAGKISLSPRGDWRMPPELGSKGIWSAE